MMLTIWQHGRISVTKVVSFEMVACGVFFYEGVNWTFFITDFIDETFYFVIQLIQLRSFHEL